MSDDIVTRLRVPLPWNLAGMTTKQLGDERRDAADEIERLREIHRSCWKQLVATQQKVSEASIVIDSLLAVTGTDVVEGLRKLSGDFDHAWKVVRGE